MANPNPTPIPPEAGARGRETQRRNREQRRQELEDELDRKQAMAVAVEALVAVASSNLEAAPRVTAAKELLHQLVGRPATVVQGDERQPIRIVVESIASPRHVREP